MDVTIQAKRQRSVVANYELGSVVGIGAYGEVRSARHIKTGKRVAVKIVDMTRFPDQTALLMRREVSCC